MKKTYQILPPFNDSKKFEEFVADFFNSLDNTKSYSLYGRNGQKQSGIDVFSTEKKVVIQCKLKDISLTDKKIVSDLLNDFESEYSSFKEFNKKTNNKFNKFILSSTFKGDVNLDDKAIQLCNDEISVEYWSWNRFLINIKDDIYQKYFSEFYSEITSYYAIDSQKKPSSIKIEEVSYGVKYEIDDYNEELDLTSHNIEEIDDNIFNQLYILINEVYSEINFIPVHILAKNKPFNKSGRSYYNSKVIHSDNKKLQDFFDSIEITDNKKIEFKETALIKDIENPEIKISYILKKLTTNLVYSISHNHQKKDIRLFGEKCDCIVCQIEDYRYEEIKKYLKNEQTDLKELLKYSYANYKVGDFEQAYTFLLQAKEIALRDNKNLSLFIINYNLHNLQKLNYRYHTSDTNQKIFNDPIINLDEDLCKNIKGKDNQIIKWIYDDKFLKSATYSINEFTSKIRVSYNNSLNGGSSNNGYVQGLINTYLNLESFVRLNFIVYDSFNEYKNTFEIFIEGLYVSHAITNEDFSKLEHFEEWLLLKMLNYGDHEKMIYFFNHYKLKELKYQEIIGEEHNIHDKILRILDFANSGNKDVFETFEANSTYFSNNFRKLYKNSIVLSAQCNFKSEIILQIAKKIKTGIIKNFSNYNDLKPIQHFLFRKKEILTEDILKELLFAFFENRYFHEFYFIESFSDNIHSSQKYLDFTDSEFKRIQNFITPKCTQCAREHDEIFLVYFFRIMKNQDQKDKLSFQINNSLANNFNRNLFKYAVIYGIIECNRNYLDQIITSIGENIKPDIKLIGQPFNFYNSAPNINNDLDFILNICFKENINLKEDLFKKFWGVNDYYDWLLDMDGFDYSKFKPKWITIYGTRFYFRKMFESQKLKEKLEEFIQSKESYDEQDILNDYLNIYVRKAWEKL